MRSKQISPHRILYAVVVLAACSVAAPPERSESGTSATPVALSEVCFLPASPNDPRWIELYNYGDRPVEIGGWCLVDKDDHVYVIPVAIKPVPPGACVLIRFTGPSCTADDRLDSSKENCAVVHCREAWASKAFKGRQNECALYRSVERKREDLVDYVRWGSGYRQPTVHLDRAQERGAWHRRDLWGIHVGDEDDPRRREDPRPGLYPGGTLARVHFLLGGRAWYIATSADASPGRANEFPPPGLPWIPPKLYYESAAKEGMNFHWDWIFPHSARGTWHRGHIQVATDPGFRNLVVDDDGSRRPYRLELGTYYARVRVYYRGPGDTQDRVTRWSKVQSFSVVPDAE